MARDLASRKSVNAVFGDRNAFHAAPPERMEAKSRALGRAE
jgi:hypothetical protein